MDVLTQHQLSTSSALTQYYHIQAELLATLCVDAPLGTYSPVQISRSITAAAPLSTVLQSLFTLARQQLQLSGLLASDIELRLKSMTDRTNVFYRTSEYAVLTSALFSSDELITMEVLSRLGRKLEPAVGEPTSSVLTQY